MPSKPYTDKVYTPKRIVKNPIKFKLQLNEEQKTSKATILENTITLLAGQAGSGKTLLACNIALDGLFRRMYDKVIITRPTVSKEEIGFLPGDMREKMDPWVQPIYQNMYLLYDNSLIIVDEAQNVTHEQMEMIVTRIGKNSKMVVCGDTFQVDLKNKSDSGFKFLYNAAKRIKNMESITLQTNNRDDIVEDLVNYYNDAYTKKQIVGTAGSSGTQKR